jgi:hypothetical protein
MLLDEAVDLLVTGFVLRLRLLLLLPRRIARIWLGCCVFGIILGLVLLFLGYGVVFGLRLLFLVLLSFRFGGLRLWCLGPRSLLSGFRFLYDFRFVAFRFGFCASGHHVGLVEFLLLKFHLTVCSHRALAVCSVSFDTAF